VQAVSRRTQNLLGLQEDATELHQTLAEEKATDEKLTLLAQNINVEAAAGKMPEDQAGAADV
jgi:ferritin-like metal-binding protein YciE